MTLRNIQRIEVVKISFDLAVIFDGVTKRYEDVFDSLTHQRDRVQMTVTWTTPRNRDVDCFAGGAGTLDNLIERLGRMLERLRNCGLSLLNQLAECRTILRRNATNEFLGPDNC